MTDQEDIKNNTMDSAKKAKEYKGFSDFFLHASLDEQKEVMMIAAQKANEDQLATFEKARLKTRTH